MLNKMYLTAILAVLTTPALAYQLDTASKTATAVPGAAPPGAPEAASAAKAPAAPAADNATVTPPDGCKWVKIVRPDIDPSKPEIYLTFRGYGGTVDAIDACNPDAVIKDGGSTFFGVEPSPTAGARVSVRTHDGVGVIGLPTVYTDGSVHQVHCKEPEGDRQYPFDFYMKRWHGGLPDEIDLEKHEMAYKVGEAICRGAKLPSRPGKPIS